MQDSHAELGVDGLQYLTFLLGDQEYGVDILRVREIKGWESVTAVPSTPAHVKGVINLRGTIVPVVDLRLRLGLEAIPYGPTTVIIIVSVETDRGTRITGLVVDAVADVFSVEREDLKEAPDFGEGADVAYIEGVALRGDSMLVALALDRLFGLKDLETLAGIS